MRKKAWTIYCRRSDFAPSKKQSLFSKEQVARDPEKIKENGYVGPHIRLRADAVPDIPLRLDA